MITYSAEYYDEFIIQAYEIYDGDKEGKSYTEIMSKIIKREYREISENIYESIAGEGFWIPSEICKKYVPYGW